MFNYVLFILKKAESFVIRLWCIVNELKNFYLRWNKLLNFSSVSMFERMIDVLELGSTQFMLDVIMNTHMTHTYCKLEKKCYCQPKQHHVEKILMISSVLEKTHYTFIFEARTRSIWKITVSEKISSSAQEMNFSQFTSKNAELNAVHIWIVSFSFQKKQSTDHKITWNIAQTWNKDSNKQQTPHSNATTTSITVRIKLSIELCNSKRSFVSIISRAAGKVNDNVHSNRISNDNARTICKIQLWSSYLDDPNADFLAVQQCTQFEHLDDHQLNS